MNLYITKSDISSEKGIVLDDMILTKDMPTSAGSKMLEGYMSLFEAEVVTKLKDKGYAISGKANVGEMAVDLLGETSYFGACTDSEGNLVGASAELVKNGDAFAALNVDCNGTPARAAALNNLVYIKPTYGTVSRFGIIPGACSGECVSVTAKSANNCSEILSVIAGHDDKDGTSLTEDKCNLINKNSGKIKKIAIAKSMIENVSDETKTLIEEFKNNCGDIEFVEIDGEELKYAKIAWNILMSAEVCNNVSKYDGVKYGYRTKNYSNIDELYTNSRTEAFGFKLKSTILFGSETLSEDNYMKVYDKALRIRRVLCEYLNSVFENVDAILLPACSKTKYSLLDVENNNYIVYDESLYTAPALITGLPRAVAGGVQLIGKAFSENSMLDLISSLCKEDK